MAPVLWSLLGARWWVVALVLYPLCFACGPDATPWRWTLPLWLGGILFFTGLRVPLAELRSAATDRGRWRLAWGFAALRLVGIPLAAWAVTRAISPVWAPGVLLVSLMPAGLSSIAFTDLLRGDRALALLAVVASSALAPLTIPLLIQAFGPAGTAIAASVVLERAAYIVAVLGLPLVAAQVVRALAPGVAGRGEVWWPRAAVVCSLVLGVVSILATKPAWAPYGLAGLLPPLALATIPVALALALGLAARRWLTRGGADALTCGGVYLNNGLAVAFAAAFFPGDGAMILPAILMILPMVAGMVVLGRR